jgi:hypothetical protein
MRLAAENRRPEGRCQQIHEKAPLVTLRLKLEKPAS